MAMDSVSFRSPILSLYQSAIEMAVRSKLGATAARPGLENGVVRAAAQVATFLFNKQPLPQAAPGNVTLPAWTTARLAWELVQAQLANDPAKANQLKSELKDGPFDLDWSESIAEYIGYFSRDGTRSLPLYTPVASSMQPLAFKAGAVVGMVADWGTGSSAAISLLHGMAQHNPDVVIHLGDIYYSGTREECDRNFATILNATFDRSRIAIYNLAGNHDMYCGGVGYYGLLKTLNAAPLPQQPASFFCLRSSDNRWQFVAMDTGRSDCNPFDVADVLVWIDPAEEDWLAQRIAEFSGRTILLSHHQLFSAFAQIGAPDPDGSLTAYNPYLDATFRHFAARPGGGIAAWFWGHEHTLTLYAPYRGLSKGRCIGHGAVPVLVETGSDLPLTRIVDPPPFLQAPLPANDHIYMHGFVILRFGDDGSATAAYYQENDASRPAFEETL